MFPTSNRVVTFTRKNKCTWFTKLLSRKLRYNPFHLRTSFLARASFLKTRRRIRHNLLPYTLFPHEISVWSIHRALNRVCHTIASTRKGGSKAKKKRLHASPLSLDGETTLDERDGFLRSAPLPFFYAVIHPPPHPLELIIQLGNSRWLGFLELFRGSLYASRPQPAPFYALLLLLLLPSPLRA